LIFDIENKIYFEKVNTEGFLKKLPFPIGLLSNKCSFNFSNLPFFMVDLSKLVNRVPSETQFFIYAKIDHL